MSAAIKQDLQNAVTAFKKLLGDQGQPAIVTAINIGLDLGFGIVKASIPGLLQPIASPILSAVEADVRGSIDQLVTEELAKASA